jgi:hypothetical protein
MVRDGRPDCMFIFEDDATRRTGNLGAECWWPTRGCVIRFAHYIHYEGPEAELVTGPSTFRRRASSQVPPCDAGRRWTLIQRPGGAARHAWPTDPHARCTRPPSSRRGAADL